MTGGWQEGCGEPTLVVSVPCAAHQIEPGPVTEAESSVHRGGRVLHHPLFGTSSILISHPTAVT